MEERRRGASCFAVDYKWGAVAATSLLFGGGEDRNLLRSGLGEILQIATPPLKALKLNDGITKTAETITHKKPALTSLSYQEIMWSIISPH